MAVKGKVRKRIFDIIQIGNKSDIPSAVFDLFITLTIFVNLFVTFYSTFQSAQKFSSTLTILEYVTVGIFTVEYILRILTADYLYPKKNPFLARILFIFSFYGLVDLLTILPSFLPFFIPGGAVAFRIFRVVRIFRLFKINSQYDAFNVIINVLKEKKNQIISCVTMILILTLASSLCMYGAEHDAQPEAFENAFSGIWWSVSTLLTVGYGDIYPITTLGKIMAIIISFLGVGMVAIPTGIISAGFVEQYTKIKTLANSEEKHDIHFVVCDMNSKHPWAGKAIKDIVLPPEVIVVAIERDGVMLIPRGIDVIESGDRMILGAHFYEPEDDDIVLSEVIIKHENPWVGKKVKDLNITRRELLVRIRRKNQNIVPTGDTEIKSGDVILLINAKKED
ncbi:MAG: ion transporter [Lachnospiraceae bacterium]|nr:ion transporter [Lachnospiraceae bacterium]